MASQHRRKTKQKLQRCVENKGYPYLAEVSPKERLFIIIHRFRSIETVASDYPLGEKFFS